MNILNKCLSTLAILSLGLTSGYGAATRTKAELKQIHREVKRGNLESVASWLEKTGDSKARYKKQTLLHTAAEYDRTQIIELLLSNGARVDARGEHKWTPLHMACMEGKFKAAQLLLEAGANIHARNKSGGCSLSYAASANSASIIEELCARANVAELINKCKLSPLKTTSYYIGQHDAFKQLIHELLKAEATIRDLSQDHTHILFAVVNRSDLTTDEKLEYLELLFSIDALPPILEAKNTSSLYAAVSARDPLCIIKLLEYGADAHQPAHPNKRFQGRTSLELACVASPRAVVAAFFENPDHLNLDLMCSREHQRYLLGLTKSNKHKTVRPFLQKAFKGLDLHARKGKTC